SANLALRGDNGPEQGIPMNAQAAASVDTGQVAGRRSLRFNSLDDVLADVDRVVAAERAGRLTRLGNWSLGQTLGHLATWAEYAYTPSPLQVPWFVKLILKMTKRKYLYGSMRAGAMIPGVPGGTLGTEPMSLDEALPRLQRALERLKQEPPTVPS